MGRRTSAKTLRKEKKKSYVVLWLALVVKAVSVSSADAPTASHVDLGAASNPRQSLLLLLRPAAPSPVHQTAFDNIQSSINFYAARWSSGRVSAAGCGFNAQPGQTKDCGNGSVGTQYLGLELAALLPTAPLRGPWLKYAGSLRIFVDL